MQTIRLMLEASLVKKSRKLKKCSSTMTWERAHKPERLKRRPKAQLAVDDFRRTPSHDAVAALHNPAGRYDKHVMRSKRYRVQGVATASHVREHRQKVVRIRAVVASRYEPWLETLRFDTEPRGRHRSASLSYPSGTGDHAHSIQREPHHCPNVSASV